MAWERESRAFCSSIDSLNVQHWIFLESDDGFKDLLAEGYATDASPNGRKSNKKETLGMQPMDSWVSFLCFWRMFAPKRGAQKETNFFNKHFTFITSLSLGSFQFFAIKWLQSVTLTSFTHYLQEEGRIPNHAWKFTFWLLSIGDNNQGLGSMKNHSYFCFHQTQDRTPIDSVEWREIFCLNIVTENGVARKVPAALADTHRE